MSDMEWEDETPGAAAGREKRGYGFFPSATLVVIGFLLWLTLLCILPVVNHFQYTLFLLTGPLPWAFLPNLVTIGIVADVAMKRFPRWALLAPLVAYICFYGWYFQQKIAVAHYTARLQATNVAAAERFPYAAFDPAQQSLILAPSGSPQFAPWLLRDLFQRADIPVVYFPCDPHGKPVGEYVAYKHPLADYMAFRLVSNDLYKKALSVKGNHLIAVAFVPQTASQFMLSAFLHKKPPPAKLWLVSRREPPPGTRISIRPPLFDGNGVRVGGVTIYDGKDDIAIDGRSVTAIDTAYALQPPPFPFYQYYRPIFDLNRNDTNGMPVFPVALEPLQGAGDAHAEATFALTPLAAELLHLPARAPGSLDNFQDDPRNVAALMTPLADATDSAAQPSSVALAPSAAHLAAIGSIPSLSGVFTPGDFIRFIDDYPGHVVYIDAKPATPPAFSDNRTMELPDHCDSANVCIGLARSFVFLTAEGAPSPAAPRVMDDGSELKGFWLVAAKQPDDSSKTILIEITPYSDALRSSAEGGDRVAEYRLGTAYLTGQGVPLDNQVAATWFERAAESGLHSAANALGDMYFDGVGVPKDLRLAYFWKSVAGENDAVHAVAAAELLPAVQKPIADAAIAYRGGPVPALPQSDLPSAGNYFGVVK